MPRRIGFVVTLWSLRRCSSARLALHVPTFTCSPMIFSWTTHPPTYERLLGNLDRIGFGENHKVYAFGFVLLEILLAHHGVEVAVDRTVSFHDMLANACFTVRSLGAA